MREKSKIWDVVQQLSPGKLKCDLCGHEFSRGAARIREYLVDGRNVKMCAKAALLSDELRAELRSDSDRQVTKRQRVELQPSIASVFGSEKKVADDRACAEFFYGCGIAFNVARSEYFKTFVKAVTQAGNTYQPPGSERLRTDLLVECQERCRDAVQPCYKQHETTGCTLAHDCWTNISGQSVNNYVVISPKGPVFHSAVDCSSTTKDGDSIAEELLDVIDELGAGNVVQCITDSTSNCVKARRIIATKHPHITVSPCAPHGLDLCLEDICKLPHLDRVQREVRDIVKYIRNHSKLYADYYERSKKRLLLPVSTRFKTVHIMLGRAFEVRASLQQAAFSEAFTDLVQIGPQAARAKAAEVKRLMLQDSLWSEVAAILQPGAPIIELLDFVNSDLPCVSKIYWKASQVETSLSQLSSDDVPAQLVEAALLAFRTRWDMMHTPLHAAAYTLDPEFWDDDLRACPEVMEGLDTMLDRLAPDDDAAGAVSQQFQNFRNKEGVLGGKLAVASASSMSPWSWWDRWGY